MDKRCIVLIGLGALMIFVGLIADMTGIGAEPEFFGWKQIALMVAGGVVIVAGFVWGRGTNPNREESESDEK